jgi:hypothetical protein
LVEDPSAQAIIPRPPEIGGFQAMVNLLTRLPVYGSVHPMKALLCSTFACRAIAIFSLGLPPFSPLLAADADAEGNWIPLFNGKNLDGWIPKIRGHEAGVNFADTFRVEHGLLKIRYDGYGDRFDNRFGHLFFHKPFSHYRLRVEYRFVGDQLPDGPSWAWRNSGIMIHGQKPETMALDQDFPVSIEIQLLGGGPTGERPTANLCTPGTHVVLDGKLHTAHCTNSRSKTYRGDEWVTVEIEVRGNDRIRHWIDGEVVLEYTQPQLDPGDATARRLIEAGAPILIEGGTISLQSESHPHDFRTVEIMELRQ